MRIKYFTLAIAAMLVSIFSGVPSLSASSVSFEMASNMKQGKVGEEFEITITGRNATDVYGYEIELKYDASLLKFQKASSGISNMIYPIESDEKGMLLLVSTKVGNVKGADGEITLGKAVFQIIGEGREAEVSMNRVKLANSKAASVQYEVSEQIQIQLMEEPVEKPEISFEDISGHWAEHNIKRAVEMGFIQGYGDGTFRPDRQVSRAEFAVMIHQAFGFQENLSALQRFKDQDLMEPWARAAISALASEGIINGYEDSTFRPGRSILRSEMAVMMASILKLDIDGTARSAFADASDMPSWAEPAIAAVARENLLQGRGSNMFRPNGLMTRAEAVKVILSMIDYMNPSSDQAS